MERPVIPGARSANPESRGDNFWIPGSARSLSSGGAKAPTRWGCPGMTAYLQVAAGFRFFGLRGLALTGFTPTRFRADAGLMPSGRVALTGVTSGSDRNWARQPGLS